MYLKEPLLRLPIRFDIAALAREIEALPAEAWTLHPQNYRGNDAVRLVTVDGEMTDDIGAPMAPTEYLKACPYILAVMAAIGGVWGRSRLMRLAPSADVPVHVDADFYWRTHVRVHVPIVTTPDVLFTCADQTVHMAAGECWVFDTFSRHLVRNDSDAMRVHLVMDTVGGGPLWDLMEAARAAPDAEPQLVPPGRTANPLAFEQHPGSAIMSPWELRYHLAFLRDHIDGSPLFEKVLLRLDRFATAWGGVWAQLGDLPDALPAYGRLIAALGADLNALGDARTLRLHNQMPLFEQIDYLVRALINSQMLSRAAPAPAPPAELRAVPGGR